MNARFFGHAWMKLHCGRGDTAHNCRNLGLRTSDLGPVAMVFETQDAGRRTQDQVAMEALRKTTVYESDFRTSPQVQY